MPRTRAPAQRAGASADGLQRSLRMRDMAAMRTVLVLLMLAAVPAEAGVLGLELGMTTAQVKAAKPCKNGKLACKGVAFAGAKVDVDLTVAKTGLSRIALATRLPQARKDAEPLADAILDKLAAEYGAIEMTGAGELKGSGALFDGADRTFEQFHGKLASGSLFHGDHAPSKATIHLGGKLVRDHKGYALEVTITPGA
jgi:hypothetical protein